MSPSAPHLAQPRSSESQEATTDWQRLTTPQVVSSGPLIRSRDGGWTAGLSGGGAGPSSRATSGRRAKKGRVAQLEQRRARSMSGSSMDTWTGVTSGVRPSCSSMIQSSWAPLADARSTGDLLRRNSLRSRTYPTTPPLPCFRLLGTSAATGERRGDRPGVRRGKSQTASGATGAMRCRWQRRMDSPGAGSSLVVTGPPQELRALRRRETRCTPRARPCTQPPEARLLRRPTSAM